MARKSLYENLNENQIKVLEQFSKKMTIRNTELKILKDYDNNNWRYNGYYDTGFFGGGRCTNGHKLRYVYEAINDNGDIIQFGEKCISEFFKVSDSTMEDIKKGIKETSKLILTIVDMVNNGKNDCEAYKEKMNFIGENKRELDHDILYKIETILGAGLPLPWWISSRIDDLAEKIQNQKEFENSLTEEDQAILVMGKMLLDGTDNDSHILRSIYGYYNNKGYITRNQLQLAKKLIKKACETTTEDNEKYEELLNKLNKLVECRMISTEKNLICSFKQQLIRNKRLSERQIEIIEKKMYKYRKQIKDIQEDME